VPAGVEPYTLIPAVFIVLAASLVKSITGFGFALLATPLLLLYWDPVLVVPIILPMVFAIDILIVVQSRHRLELRRVAPMMVTSVAGIPLGTYVLLAAPAQALKLAIGVLILISAGLLLMGFSITISRERLAGGVAGFLSGILTTSTSLGGPPVTLFMLNQQWAKDTFRNSLGLFFLVLNILSVIALASTSTLNGSTLLASAVLMPPVLVGYVVAKGLLPRIPQQAFRRGSILIVLAAGILAMLSTL